LKFSAERFGSIKRASWASPDNDSPELTRLELKSDSTGFAVTVPEVNIYTLVVLELGE
jgi:hypothetical protein